MMYDSYDYVDEPPFDDEPYYFEAILELESEIEYYDELAVFYETHERELG